MLPNSPATPLALKWGPGPPTQTVRLSWIHTVKSPQHSTEHTAGKGHSGCKWRPPPLVPPMTGSRASCPHVALTPTKPERQIPNKDISQAVSSAPQHPSTCRHSLCPEKGLCGQPPNSRPRPASGLVPALVAALSAPGPVHPCVCMCACAHTHMCKHDFIESREQQEVFLL